MLTWVVTSDEQDLTVLEVMQRRLPAAPPGYLRQLVRGGKVRREGSALRADQPLREGDRLNLPKSRRLRQLQQAAGGGDTPILFESREILVVYKPAGLAVHRGVGHEEANLVERVTELMQLRKTPFRTSPVHRLDLETSGPVLFGKGRAATSRLGKLFMADAVEKRYLALVWGRPPREGELTTPVPAKGRLKEARTRYRNLAGSGDFSLVELRPRSGRTHQIRRQMAAAGHPLAGDRRYDGPLPPGLDRLFLHCSRLALTDPFRDVPLVVESPLPPELAALLESLGLFLPSE